jgi:hypothetical protein
MMLAPSKNRPQQARPRKAAAPSDASAPAGGGEG